jgi:hypothetical protein
MPNTYTELRKTTVGTATSSVTLDLTGISGYTDLVLVAFVRNTSGSATDESLNLEVNGDSGSNYSFTQLYGNGSTASSNRVSNTTVYSSAGRVSGGGTTAGTFGANIIQLQNYSNTTTNKTFLTRGNTAESYALTSVGLWRSTAAITSIKLSSGGGFNLAVGSTFSLYGIANADLGAAKATGGIITEDANYWYHTFAASGAFITKQALTVDCLVIAGGGGGASRSGAGGGGAGGYREATGLSLTTLTNYSVTVGAGGVGGEDDTSPYIGSNGSNSIFSSITSTGGGAGGLSSTAASGGSGGGGGRNSGSGGAGNTPSTSPSQGNNGGSSGSGLGGGGGGGAGAVGGNGGATDGGAGGAGVSSSFTGISVTRAGGGGGSAEDGTGAGGAGGAGGGGAGASLSGGSGGSGVSGTMNTGGGGGGGGYSSGASVVGGTGGSGLVVIRYAK